ncbi:MAG: PfkB family carbohydrate kinase [Dongiaceae bacterium]
MSVSLSCVGAVFFDEVFRLPALPAGDGKYFASALLEGGGGMAATAAVAAAALGGRVALHGRIGDDAAGRFLEAALARAGIDPAGCRRVDGARTSHSAVLVAAGGERMIIVHVDPALDRDPGWLPVDAIAGSDAVLADVRWPEGARAAFAAARRGAGIAVLDADVTDDAATAGLLPMATHVVFSEAGLQRLVGAGDLEAGLAGAATATAGTVAVTAGSRGCFWREGGRLRRVPAPALPVVNTLGAGDVFHGAFALALAERRPLAAALAFATAAASLKCTRAEGWTAMPDRAAVERLAASLPPGD